MGAASFRIVRAWLDSFESGIAELDRDWTGPGAPPVALTPAGPSIVRTEPAPPLVMARAYGYYLPAPGEIAFVFPADEGLDGGHDRIYLAGDFNGWEQAVDQPKWELAPAELDGERVHIWRGPAGDFLREPSPRFKFVTGEHLWPAVPSDAANAERDDRGNVNRRVRKDRTGRHLWRIAVEPRFDLSRSWSVSLPGAPPVPLLPGRFFYALGTDRPLGARVEGDSTVFRLFAPRVRSVSLHLQAGTASQPVGQSYALSRLPGEIGVWELALQGNLHGWRYWYTVEAGEGPAWPDAPRRILDPYALAAVGREGPGIVLDSEAVGRGDTDFVPPAWHDLIVAEAHVRDLTANAPVSMPESERLGFAGLQRWVESPDFYLAELGVNCVELQPVQEFDNVRRDEYHWGYMTANFFAPASAYSATPEEASGVRELQELVRAFHRRGMAVVLDVVYNHVGMPNHLGAIDPLYFFDHDPAGRPTNWSGCGNDLRASSAMVKRLIVDSLSHLVTAFGVDGFRFDLAELLGVPLLREIEAALKTLKPGIILIAEPWSLRGHLAGALRETGYASWNDGYRDFVRDYVLARGDPARLEYHLRGSPWYFARWPAQTVNYTQSHDDRAWIDLITENAGFDGSHPTPADARRTRLMAAVLFMSVGIPMIAEGQDLLHSKHGVNNTYQRGDLNALDYRGAARHLATHAYFADWIAFRLSEHGRLLRHFTRTSEGFFQFFRAKDSPALAVLCNADGSWGADRLLFAVNPSDREVVFALGAAVADRRWRQVADQNRFYTRPMAGSLHLPDGDALVPPLGCGLWLSEE